MSWFKRAFSSADDFIRKGVGEATSAGAARGAREAAEAGIREGAEEAAERLLANQTKNAIQDPVNEAVEHLLEDRRAERLSLGRPEAHLVVAHGDGGAEQSLYQRLERLLLLHVARLGPEQAQHEVALRVLRADPVLPQRGLGSNARIELAARHAAPVWSVPKEEIVRSMWTPAI